MIGSLQLVRPLIDRHLSEQLPARGETAVKLLDDRA